MLKAWYFSGTGNARNVAHWLAASWRASGREAEVIDLSKQDPAAIAIGPQDAIALASPTHGFNFPPITLAFLVAFPRTRHRNQVFIFNTRAGMRFFGVHLPGLSGVAQILAAAIFILKGYRVRAMRPVDLPSNWISLHPGLREENVRALYARCARQVARCAERVLSGRRDLRALYDLPQDLLISPVSILYYLIGRFFFAKSFIASRACDGCGICVSQCPVKAVSLVKGRPYWSFQCESCMHCMNQCPKRAIETAHGFLVAYGLLLAAALYLWIYPAWRPAIPYLFGEGYFPAVLRFLLETGLFLGILFPAYRILHHLRMRFPLLDRWVALTSLSHFAFWRRYRAPKAPGI
jgi:ferredoxin